MTAKMFPDGKLYKDKYNIYDPDSVNFVERTDFLKALSGKQAITDDMEDAISSTSKDYDLLVLANYYKDLKRRNARLPKFSRWITGMFADNKKFAEELARAGQSIKKTITISTDLVDILRSGDTTHFSSCYGIAAGMPSNYKIPVVLAETAPGIAMAYIDDDNGFMMGREWLVHARDNDGDLVVLSPYPVGNIQQSAVVKLLKDKGHRVALPSSIYDDNGKEVEYVDGLKVSTNFDVPTWATKPLVKFF